MSTVFCFLCIFRFLKLRHCFAPIICFIDMGIFITVEVYFKTAFSSKVKNQFVIKVKVKTLNVHAIFETDILYLSELD